MTGGQNAAMVLGTAPPQIEAVAAVSRSESQTRPVFLIDSTTCCLRNRGAHEGTSIHAQDRRQSGGL